MKIGIMQPYLFPYLGYFQLINSIDVFVIYDDVQYMKGGFINRNSISVNKQKYMFHFSVEKDHLLTRINERFYNSKFEYQRLKFLKTLEASYKKADYFSETFNLVEKVLNFGDKNVARFNGNSIRLVCEYLDIPTRIIYSSKHFSDDTARREERVMNICKRLNGKEYINSIGGIELYSKDHFEANGLRLSFLKMNEIEYLQFGQEFIPNLSIIDVMMFNSKEKIINLLKQYVLV